MTESIFLIPLLLITIFFIGGSIFLFRLQNQKIHQLQKQIESLAQKQLENPNSDINSEPISITAKNPEKNADSHTVINNAPQKTPAIVSSSPSKPDFVNIEINEDFQKALAVMEDSLDCVFITGKAGTGKSTLLKYFVANTKKQVAILAPTGIAALNINGETIHSFFRFPPHPLKEDEIKESPNKVMYQSIDTIVIDEISMVRSDLLDAIDKFLRVNGKNANKPFGGIQLIFMGDLYQLPPIVSEEAESQFFATNYQSQWFFDAHLFQSHTLKLIELTRVYRQKSTDFITLLDAIRIGHFNDAQLQKINQRCQIHPNSKINTRNITLASTNKIASQINETQLSLISFEEFVYTGIIEGEFLKKALPTDTVLRLKKGSQVMFVKNDSNHRWVNGTIGKIHHLEADSIQVEVSKDGNSFIYEVSVEKWELLKYKYNFSTGKLETEVIGSFAQYPVRLAWAITIHKSQGLTFDQVVLDLGNGAFAAGQTYVALSRCTSYEGIFLKTPIRKSDIRVDKKVNQFFAKANSSVNLSTS